MSSFPSNYLAPVAWHGLSPTEPFIYSAPLRADSPFELPLRSPPRRHKELHANLVWSSSILLGDAIIAGELEVKGKRVLELGAGVGLPSLLAAKKGAEKVTISDFDDEEMVQDLRENLGRTLPIQLQSKVEVLGHTWGDDITKLQSAGPFDLILAADLVWVRSSHPLLIASLLRLLETSPSAIIHLACGFHSGKAVVRDFFASAEEAGLVPTKTYEGNGGWFEISVTGEKKDWSKYGHCGELELAQEERNRWTLLAALQRGW